MSGNDRCQFVRVDRLGRHLNPDSSAKCCTVFLHDRGERDRREIFSHPLDELIAEGENVAFRCRYEGTHTGAEFMGVQASGRRISITGVGVMGVTDGKVAEFWVSPDRMTPCSKSVRC